jgi:hypothetical protein
MLRREVVKAVGGLFGLGAGTPSRFPYEDRPQPSPGVGPSQGQNVRARIVTVFGANGGIFVYSGTPAKGNLIASTAATAGTDAFGNAYLSGFTSYINVGGTFVAAEHRDNGLLFATAPAAGGPWISASSGVQWTTTGLFISHANEIVLQTFTIIQAALQVTSTAEFDGTLTFVNGAQSSTMSFSAGNAHPIFSKEVELTEVATPSAPGTGIKVFSDTVGVPRVVGVDGSVMAFGSRTNMFTGTQAITVNGFTTLNDGANNLSANVGIGRYRIRARVIYQATGIVGAPTFTLTAPASQGGITYDFDYNGNASGICRYDNASGFGSSEAGPANATVTAAVIVTLDITGTASFSATGTRAVRASIGGAGNSTFNVVQGSFLEVGPM